MKKNETPLSIFLYMDYREFLRDWHALMKRGRAGFSLRSFARRAGFQSHNFLKFVMQGKRNLTPESVRKFLRALRLDRREADYFQNLVAYNQAADPIERQRFYEKLLQLQEIAHVRLLSEDQYNYYGNWYHTAVRELVSYADFQEDPEWIASRLSPIIKSEEARASLELLQRLGLVRRDESGRLSQTDKLLTTGPEVSSAVVTRYHRAILDLAKQAIDRFPRQQRDISALTLGVSRQMLPILKRRVQLFREEMLRLISTDGGTDTVIQFNCQLFPVTSESEGGTGA